MTFIFLTDRSKALSVLEFFFVCASMVTNVEFVPLLLCYFYFQVFAEGLKIAKKCMNHETQTFRGRKRRKHEEK